MDNGDKNIQTDKSEKEEDKKKLYRLRRRTEFSAYIVKVFFALAIMIFGVEYLAYTQLFPMKSDDPNNWGLTGDFFGGTLNPLLQFIIILMLFWSTRIQQEELGEIRQELKENRMSQRFY